MRVDSSASQVDESRIRKLVKGATDRPFGVIEVSQVPLAELLRQVNLTIESSPQLNGCDISGAEMVLKRMGGEVKYTLAFAGQVAEARQLPLMSSAVNRLMTPHAFWGKQLERGDFVTLFDQLNEVPTSTYAGKQYYGQALTEYRKGNYVDATALFGGAVTATPANLAWRYWRVVALLQQGDEAAALDHMRSIVARGESHRARSEIATALERVQGSVRQQLIKLEDQAMTTPALMRGISRDSQVRPIGERTGRSQNDLRRVCRSGGTLRHVNRQATLRWGGGCVKNLQIAITNQVTLSEAGTGRSADTGIGLTRS